MKKQNIIITIIILALFLISGILAFFLIIQTKPSANQFTSFKINAMEANNISKQNIIQKYNPSVLLPYQVSSSGIDFNGNLLFWNLDYYMELNSSHYHVFSKIYVNQTNQLETTLITNITIWQKIRDEAINNWTVDSDSAFAIAKTNKTIEYFIEKSDNGYMFMKLYKYPKWYFEFIGSGLFGTPSHATMHIDANNGQILNVTNDDE
jgi:hypothetical protein